MDRARLREDTGEDDVAKRINALEEMVKLGQMEQEAFERVRDEIIGGDIKNVHLVKGLDKKLLGRARRGEDVYVDSQKDVLTEDPKDEVNIEEELEEMEAKEVVPTIRAKEMTDNDTNTASKKRTRDDIIEEMKEARRQATEESELQKPVLGSRFRKVIEMVQPGTSRLETDDRGREVLVIMDKDGNLKRKIKKSRPAKETILSTATLKDKTSKSTAALGADVTIPEKPSPKVEEPENDDIFADAGTDYNPLADIDGSDSDTGSKPGEAKTTRDDPKSNGPRNYFNETPAEHADSISDPAHDPEFLAAIRNAATVADRLDKCEHREEDDETLKKLARRKEMLQAHDRDADDLDLGFGSSRFDDQEEGEGKYIKLSKWKGTKDDDKDEKQKKQGGKKKKKKGDKNSATDVLAVLERRKKS